MRRQNRKSNVQDKTLTDKIILYVGIGVAILAVIAIALFMYSKNLSDDVKNSTMSLEKMANIANNVGNTVSTENAENTQNTENTESASTEIGKSVEESANELNSSSSSNSNSSNNSNTSSNSNKTNTENQTIANTPSKTNATKQTTSDSQNKENNNVSNKNENQNTTQKSSEETKKELKFVKPVEGDIVREYAKDNLIYSDTLEEWTTHLGIDIKAEKTTVVNSAEAGTVKSIKNDPRYGLTIAIDHGDGYQTIYSNLLTSEYVVEGEKVEKGQAIGTVGNTGVFEIVDEPHLHFEILKDSLQVDPSIYIK